MNRVHPVHPTTDRVMLIVLDGASFDVLVPLAEAGVMPNLAGWMQSAALVQVRSVGPVSDSAASTTLQTGCGPGGHGVLDDHYLDHRRGKIVPQYLRPLPCPTLAQLVTEAGGESSAAYVEDFTASAPSWDHRPNDYRMLSRQVARTRAVLNRVAARSRQIDRSRPWRLLQVRLRVLDGLQHHLWNLLGVGRQPGGNPEWVAKTQQAIRAVDDCLGELLVLADRSGAAVIVASAHGFVPSRERIVLPELFRRRGLLHVLDGAAAIGYRLSRVARKARRWLPQGFSTGWPVGSVLPVDWRRARTVTLHGQFAALVYLNTPERFATGVLTTTAARNQAADDVVAALRDARHPATDEPLFVEVYRTDGRYDQDPLAAGWPEVVANTAAGFHARHRLDRHNRLVIGNRSLTATHGGDGLMIVGAPGVVPGKPCIAEARDVAPTVLRLLGMPPGAQMTGRPLDELFDRCRDEAGRGRVYSTSSEIEVL